ncbi:hypothetical protein MBUL_03669 [Methylobacterium bullatum]|uniref:Acyltransferase 3 domain-containing protein n=1 Tax=Methylobacterium bullatum TaxID=570505 RepID=A0A679JFQ1_9HYPH|nr:hypothetical protein MBUL_03669 [Methylobacterium bullatum]
MASFLRATSIGDALALPSNAFSVLRLALAVAVVVSHVFSVGSGDILDEPLKRSTGFTLGEHAVNGFFGVSGFLVAMSLERRGPWDYVLARAFRILPGLVAATLVAALVLGPALTRLSLDAYLHDPGLWRFVQGTLTTFKSNTALPGLFVDNPSRAPLGTVWTLKYEVLCYLGLLGVGLAGLFRRGFALGLVIGLAVALALLDALNPALPKGVETALRLPLIFASGSAFYLWRARVPRSGWLLAGLVLAAVLAQGSPLYRTVLFLAEAYGMLWLAFSPVLGRPAFEPPVDLSYGIYLYGWPIQQSLHAFWPAASSEMLLLPALLLTAGVAALSWKGIEEPALRLKAHALRRSAKDSPKGGAPDPGRAEP